MKKITLPCSANSTLFAISTPIIVKNSLTQSISYFQEIPVIFFSLIILLLLSLGLGIYCLAKFSQQASLPKLSLNDITLHLSSHNVEEALKKCQTLPLFTAKLFTCGIAALQQHPSMLKKVLQAENRRISHNFWKKADLLNRFATIGCLIGILGSILCFFYHNNSLISAAESILTKLAPAIIGIFIGLFSKLFYTILKYRESKIINYIQHLALKVGTAVHNEQK